MEIVQLLNNPNSRKYISIGTCVLLLLVVLWPWIILVATVFGAFGWYSVHLLARTLKLDKEENFIESTPYDPLSNFEQQTDLNNENSFLSSEKTGNNRQRSSSKIELPKPDPEFLIPERLDISLSRFFNVIFDHYISSKWAPYYTRQQIKVDLKKLLTSFGRQVHSQIIAKHDNGAAKFCFQKCIPLLLHHLLSISGDTKCVLNKEDRDQQLLKVRQLCRKILKQHLKPDDRNCNLAMELCVAVLADGVLWNVMNLGNVELFRLLKIFLQQEQQHISLRTIIYEKFFLENEPHIETDIAEQEQNVGANNLVPFLLNHFLDPKDCNEKPDCIISRWRPTLKEIKNETELLYPLIQYLKSSGGQKTVSYLQGWLEDSSEGSLYCQRVLESEFLPGFSRSSQLLESLGLSRVEQALEVGLESPAFTR